jgi:hypothetical protein
MRNVVVGHEALGWVIAGAGAVGRGARLGNEMRGTDRIIRLDSGVVLYEDEKARYCCFVGLLLVLGRGLRMMSTGRDTSQRFVAVDLVLGMRSRLDWPSPLSMFSGISRRNG